jgi:hypothetical protein
MRQTRDRDDLGWAVYDDLTARMNSGLDAVPLRDDAIAVERRLLAAATDGQRDVWVLNNLRSEVNSGGFEAYFLWHADSAPLAPAAAGRFGGESWRQLVVDAMAIVGDPFPTDWSEREERVFELAEVDDDAFTAVDHREYDLEADAPVDPTIDSFIRGNPQLFYRRGRLSQALRRRD